MGAPAEDAGEASAAPAPSAVALEAALVEAHRQSWGRLVGWLFRRSGDLAASEDAVATAFARAALAWRAGIPTAPEAWLRVVARRALLDGVRANGPVVPVDPTALPERALAGADEQAAVDGDDGELDPRLALLLVCAHPAIDARVHAPLMMQVVLGIDAARIASAFLAAPSTMGQRLSRAKAKIRDARIRFRRPEPAERTDRLAPVLSAVYAAYTVCDPLHEEEDPGDAAVREESIRLARELAEAFPDHGDAHGLLALLLHTEGRRTGRFHDGRFVPLDRQDPSRWHLGMLAEGDAALDRARSLLLAGGRVGRYELEAAISAIHSSRALGAAVDHSAVRRLYGVLEATAPSTGAAVGAAGAALADGDTAAALERLDRIETGAVAQFAPYWVCRAAVERALGLPHAAAASRAVGLTRSPALRAHLLRELGGG